MVSVRNVLCIAYRKCSSGLVPRPIFSVSDQSDFFLNLKAHFASNFSLLSSPNFAAANLVKAYM